jgi:hypothetical protein
MHITETRFRLILEQKDAMINEANVEAYLPIEIKFDQKVFDKEFK